MRWPGPPFPGEPAEDHSICLEETLVLGNQLLWTPSLLYWQAVQLAGLRPALGFGLD